MSSTQTRPRPAQGLIIPSTKHETSKAGLCVVGQGGSLSPNLQPNTPPALVPCSISTLICPPCKIGEHLLLEMIDSTPSINAYKSVSLNSKEDCICKVVKVDKYKDTLASYYKISSYEHIIGIKDLIVGQMLAYVFFPLPHSDLHSYVRSIGKLKECEAIQYFKQIVSAVAHCHESGVILRDIKLRKCVFKDSLRTNIKICGLEDACILIDPDDDHMMEKHGCPAYVSPEILLSTEGYSGKAADVWSLGVILYTMLVGRYPFQDSEPSVLFAKISVGRYALPDTISSRGRCLIRGMLRKDPVERLSANDILSHPWLRSSRSSSPDLCLSVKQTDQNVPETMDDSEDRWICL